MKMDHANLHSSDVRSLIRSGMIRFAGNKRLRIYGRLDCQSGKRMKRINRVFFSSVEDALSSGYRACKKCMLKSAWQTTLLIKRPGSKGKPTFLTSTPGRR